MIVAEGLHFGYGDQSVLRGLDLTARPGRVLGLLGPNGSGKTTALRMLYGSLRPHAGRVSLDGRPLASLGPRQVSRRVAVVVQENDADSLLTVREMVTLGRLPRLSTFQRTGVADHRAVDLALERVGASHLVRRRFAELSGGERQRVLVARALAQESDFLLLDEPTNHLDVRYQHEVLDLVRTVAGSAVIVLHDLNLAARYCDDLVLLDQGRVVRAGSPDHVLDPATVESVYGIGVSRTELAGPPQLLFHPLAPARTTERLPA
ncbi:histidinol phosphatase [Nocardioides sp. Root190]|uniref:ABC transporter ATP-binding protein n=1 Tax=Nocardioides sp. Root190 TaxID=1736488 RepID=UPI0006F685F4|nr:ABC transporter ATP-binding protein [Nocardioides sp. Root190]KRB79264.1 histidinol phosphatase [Nocardioides sp. Root190]